MSTAIERVRAYTDAVPMLYDDDNPMPEGLTIDTATAWSSPPDPRDSSHDLTYADLVEVLDRIEQHEGEPCGQVSALTVGRLSGPCVVLGRHTEHRADNGDTWTESVR